MLKTQTEHGLEAQRINLQAQADSIPKVSLSATAGPRGTAGVEQAANLPETDDPDELQAAADRVATAKTALQNAAKPKEAKGI
jgi:hypothetical protein